MVAIPRKRDEATVEAVYAALEQAAEDGFRPHLGFSVIGRECLRAVWYGWRWATNDKHEGRVLRLFRRGKLEEEWLAKDLQAAGECRVIFFILFIEILSNVANGCVSIYDPALAVQSMSRAVIEGAGAEAGRW